MQPDAAWGGPIRFYELIFGTWLAYAVLVLMWEKLLRVRLPEWQYMLLIVIAASFFFKDFTDPIERTVEATAQLRTSYTNAAGARNTGFELDVR